MADQANALPTLYFILYDLRRYTLGHQHGRDLNYMHRRSACVVIILDWLCSTPPASVDDLDTITVQKPQTSIPQTNITHICCIKTSICLNNPNTKSNPIVSVAIVIFSHIARLV